MHNKKYYRKTARAFAHNKSTVRKICETEPCREMC